MNRKGEPTKIYRLLISTEYENVTRFMTVTKMNYCIYKAKKLEDTISKFTAIKRSRYKDLIIRGYSKETATKLLRLSPAAWCIIENKENHIERHEEEITTRT